MAATKELQYLNLRQMLKEEVRKKMHKQNGSFLSLSPDEISKYAWFFGPKQSVLAQRIFEQGKALLQNLTNSAPTAKELNIAKIQRLKESRDYSFLLSDSDRATEPMRVPEKSQLHSKPNSTNKPKLGSTTKPILHPKQNSINKSKCKLGSVASRKQSKSLVPYVGKKAPASGSKMEQKSTLKEPNKPKVVPKQPEPKQNSSSNSTLQHCRQNRKRKIDVYYESENDQDEDDYDLDDEGQRAIRIIRRMFNTKRFLGRDDADTDMETNFREINKEEKRSERLARKEDREQLRLIEEEELREGMKKLEKKRKVNQQIQHSTVL